MKAKKLASFGFTLFLLGSINIVPAHAHTSLISEIPVGNSEITELPTEITLTFDETLIVIGEANSVVVTDPKGTEITSGDTQVKNNLVTRQLKQSNIAGQYSVTYRVVSEDGHVVSNSYHFVVKDKKTDSAISKSSSAIKEDIQSTPSASASEKVAPVNSQHQLHTGHSFWEHHAGHIFMALAALILIYIWKKQAN